MLVLLYVIPARLVVPGMTDVGRPAMVVALVMWCWWVFGKLNPQLVMPGPQPLRWAVLAYLVSALVSYAIGQLRGLTYIEANGADRAMIIVAMFVGTILLVADGVKNWDRLTVVLQALVGSAVFMSVVGILQFVLKIDITEYLIIPGLQDRGGGLGFEIRGAGVRVASTAYHYIEFGTVCALALPFALHLAMYSKTRMRKQVFFFAALIVAAAVPMSVSRTAIVAVGAALIVLLPVWTWRTRYNVLALFVGLIGAFMVAVPGLVGTIKNLFFAAGEDTSVTARTARYDLVGHYFSQRPWLGRGTGTWLAPQYQILDNEWLMLALSNGIIGVAALLALHVTAAALAFRALKRAQRPEDKHLSAALLSTQLIAVLVAGTFDSLSFTTYALTLAVLIGCCGVAWRLTHPNTAVRTSLGRAVRD